MLGRCYKCGSGRIVPPHSVSVDDPLVRWKTIVGAGGEGVPALPVCPRALGPVNELGVVDGAGVPWQVVVTLGPLHTKGPPGGKVGVLITAERC